MKSSFEFQPTNPFSTSFIAPSQVVYRFSHGANATSPHNVDAQLESLLAKLKSTRRALIVGPHGTGKSTLLHTFLPKLQRSYPQVAFHQLNNDPSMSLRKRLAERFRAGKRIRDGLMELPQDGLLVVDGWEQMTHLSRLRLARTASNRKLTLLATCHYRMPGWTVLHETRANPKLIRSLAEDLLSDSPYELRKMIDGHLKERRLTPTTNVRELWFEMYDVVEDAHAHELKFHG
ncbi:ATP-binding protein [Stieleria sp. ICT_E10.1]|uniref:ATP-binding protein n=1 Tax=Stieleria sedimenti TaxID=2976331 RepID=UPI00217FF1F3|nr:ATP-binding protein [Stieleria sedimenti]MCS7467848.1 ATP-binding protein [Stieleria sedimenti]